MYGPVRTVVWGDGGCEASSYPILEGDSEQWSVALAELLDERAIDCQLMPS